MYTSDGQPTKYHAIAEFRTILLVVVTHLTFTTTVPQCCKGLDHGPVLHLLLFVDHNNNYYVLDAAGMGYLQQSVFKTLRILWTSKHHAEVTPSFSPHTYVNEECPLTVVRGVVYFVEE